ncbi:DUF6090 family protein [Winogradskyella sp.]|uniref:DUF6090 family protein n=1 Tax=Winogradskyella sp. TaxID=1883156 RepID=UPI00345C5B5E
MENKTAAYFKYAIGEIFLVVVGILIALQINNWNDKIKAEEAKFQILTSIKKEIQANKEHIEAVFPYHNMLRDTLRTLDTETMKTTKTNPLGFWKGHRIFRLRTASFQTAVQSGLMKDFDLELSESLNNLYTSVQFYNDFGQTVSNGIFEINQTTEEGTLHMFNFVKMIMEDVHYAESELLKGFDINLEEIDAEFNFL